jgi:hypothetical protein
MMAATVMMLCATIGVAWFVKRRDASPHASHSIVHHPAPWNGRFWTLAPACERVVISGWLQADRALTRPIIAQSANAYAKEKGIKPRDCAKEL